MIHFCLLVSSIVGSWCYEAPRSYDLPGHCQYTGDVFICEVDADDLQIRASWYNPAEGGIHCMEPCDQLGDGSPVASGYGRFAACPLGWYGRFVEYRAGYGRPFMRQCRDHGGDVVPTCGFVWLPGNGRFYTCFIIVDFLETSPPWFYALLLDWSVKDTRK